MSVVIGLIAVLLPTTFIFADKIIEKFLPNGSLSQITDDYDNAINNQNERYLSNLKN